MQSKTLSSQPKAPIASSMQLGWQNLVVEQFHQPIPGQATLHNPSEHTICLCLAARPFQLVQVRDNQIHRGLHGKGDITITPAGLSSLEQWEGEDYYLRIRIAAAFLNQVATEALDLDADQISIVSECKTRDLHIEHIGMTLLSELNHGQQGSNLYVESLSNVLAVHLLRQYSTRVSSEHLYTGGLTEQQLRQVIDYVDAYLGQEVKLSELARLLDMSQFHFSRCFKQSVGMSPHQYVMQQRMELAKRLLEKSETAIADIALQCGFNSQSHFGKYFRSFTGATPNTYRKNRA